MRFILLSGLLFFLIFSKAFASQNAQDPFYQAYDTCSKYGQYITKKDCDFGNIYKNYYQSCMEKNGYSDDADLDSEQYKQYMESYNYCSTISDNNSKKYCRYTEKYNSYYQNCMLKYGFNSEGERVQETTTYFEFEY